MMIDLTNKTELLEYLKANGLWAKKSFSQNFLVDRGALDKIVEAAELSRNDFVIEIGPGLGTLTRELVKNAGEVVAVEFDERLAKLLAKNMCHSSESWNPGLDSGSRAAVRHDNKDSKDLCNGQLQVINADILKVNLNDLIGDRKYKVVANIPYHITSKILELFLSRDNKPEAMVLLVQKEVAERVAAKPGDLSVLAVSVQVYGEPEIVSVVPKDSFLPSPKVDSAVLKIVIARNEMTTQSMDRHAPPTAGLAMTKEDERAFFRLVHIGFASRRKTLSNNLSAGYHITKEEAAGIIKSIGLTEMVRAQELSVEEWKKLLNALSEKKL